MPEKVRVLLADDHAVLRSGLSLLINNQKDFSVVGEAPTGIATIALSEELAPDLLLLDINMPKLGGLEIITTLKQKSPDMKILILTMHDEPEYLRQALKSGASGYILKKAADTELLSAMRAVINGEVYVHSAITKSILKDMLPEEVGDKEKDEWEDLSPREKQVLRLVALGHTRQEIAEKIGLSSKTVDTYRARGMDKLGLKTRASLVRFALQRHLLN
ncbi:MAG: response regulator transcription factor [Anaerolineales bacterium]